MEKLLPIILLIFSPSILADWVQFNNESKNKYFFEIHKVEREFDLVFVWQKIQYKDATEHGDYSSSTYYKINCRENTIQFLSTTFYSDKNWTVTNWAGKKGQENVIKSNSQEGKLRNIVCEK